MTMQVDISHIDDSESESELDDSVQDDEDVSKGDVNGHRRLPEKSIRDIDMDNEETSGGDNDDGGEEDAEEGEDDNDDEDADIPLSELSDLSSTAKEDILPHQRLTINNTSALLKSLKSIALPLSTMSFSEHQSITTESPVSIEDVEDDLNRELAFYRQSLDAVKRARTLLKAEGVPFSRPPDYFAEMVKSDEHMGRIKRKLVDEAANKKAAADARKQRDLKRFGKQVQIAKLQERDRAKRETLDRIQLLKKSMFLLVVSLFCPILTLSLPISLSPTVSLFRNSPVRHTHSYCEG